MIQTPPTTVLYLNKFSVLFVSIMLITVWTNIQLSQSTSHHASSTPSAKQTTKDTQNTSKYFNNPFLNNNDVSANKENLPTTITIHPSKPSFLSLQLKLHGIVYQNNARSYVMISQRGAIQEIFRVNDEISKDVYLTQIRKNQIEVVYFGKNYVLHLSKRQNTSPLISGSSTHTAVDKLSITQQNNYLEVDKQRNPIRLFMIRRPFASYSMGEFQGYKIMPGSNADQFKRLGFESGDIITYLNGTEFTGPGMKEFVIKELTHATHIDLIVMRGNQELSINYGF